VEAGRGNAAAAEAAFRKALEIDSKSIPSRLALAHFLWSQGRLADTEQTLKDALEIDRESDLGNRMLAVFYVQQNRLDDAETPLLRLVNTKDPAATLTLADLYVRTGRAERARPLYEALGRQKENHSVSVARLASLDYDANQKGKAYGALDAVLQAEPRNTHLLTLKAQWLLTDGRLPEALATATKAVESDRNSAASHYILGRTHAAMLNAPAAISSLNEALRLNPQFGLADLELARVLLGRGEYQQALTHARSARKQLPADPDAGLVLVRALIANKDTAAADAELQPLLRAHAGSAQVQSVLGQVLMAKSDSRGAEQALDKALDLNPTDLEALTARLAIDSYLKHAVEGRARLARALQKQPDDPDLLALAGRFEWSVGNTAAAEKYLRTTLEKNPAKLDAYTALGQMYISQQRLEEARVEFERIAQRSPDPVAARTMVGMLLEAQGKPEQARKIYEGIIASGSRAPVAANNLAYQYAAGSEQLDVALNLAQTAKTELPDNPEVSDTLGWVYYKRGLADLAIPPLEFSVSKDPQRPEYLLHLGLAYAKAGRTDKARETLQRALSINAGVEGAAEARAVLSTIAAR
jgi:tetratricopeptide (TPR) repeat protein